MINYDKNEIKNALSVDNVFELVHEWGGDPRLTEFGFISATICHNEPGEGSHKLYFYENSGLFQCYTGCSGYFDIFELTRKVAKIQNGEEIDLNDAVRWIAKRFGIAGTEEEDPDPDALTDWIYLSNYDRIQEIEPKANKEIILKEYDDEILDRFNYSLRIGPWLQEGISQKAIEDAHIGFYPGGDQITIPHYDKDGRFIGLRGRTLCEEEGERFGKYRPLKVNKQLYNHPLGMNLYNYNKSKKNIGILGKAIVFEGEKSTLLYKTYFGIENDISVACCGSSLSAYQMQLLIAAGAKEVIIAFDRQFKEIGDKEYKHLTSNLMKIAKTYKNDIVVSCIFDKDKITSYKASPIDEGRDKFLTLFKQRIVL